MHVVRSIDAYYPTFPMGCRPMAIKCHLDSVEANGRRYTKTPFAMLDEHGPDDLERLIGQGYYATMEETMAYLDSEYPWYEQAAPIMQALFNAQCHEGDVVGTGRIADKCGVSVHSIHLFARGQRRFGLKAIRAAVKALAASCVPA